MAAEYNIEDYNAPIAIGAFSDCPAFFFMRPSVAWQLLHHRPRQPLTKPTYYIDNFCNIVSPPVSLLTIWLNYMSKYEKDSSTEEKILRQQRRYLWPME